MEDAVETAKSGNHSAAGAVKAAFTLPDLVYELPDGLVAQRPLPRRDESRLLVVDRSNQSLQDANIGDLPGALRPGDLLILNDTKVVPAKFTAYRKSGGKVGGLFEQEIVTGEWWVMLEGSKRLRVSEVLTSGGEGSETIALQLLEAGSGGRWRVAVNPRQPAEEILERIGRTPLPPYIHRENSITTGEDEDRARYQTVYAQHPGAIAAPTAGLHLTDALLQRIRDAAIETAFVTLHVGLGTFSPIRSERLAEHTMHGERFELSEETAQAVNACRARSGRVVAVGTTSVRVLESVATGAIDSQPLRAKSGVTNIFIYPPARFRMVDALLTNFHLPRSTLLALVMAFAGVETIRQAYRHAIEERYRFYSYGDAMLIV